MSAASVITDQCHAAALPLDAEVEPFQVTRKKLPVLFDSPQLVKQMIAADWIRLVRPGKPGRESLFDFQSAKKAYARLMAGEEPPPLPLKAKNKPEEQQ